MGKEMVEKMENAASHLKQSMRGTGLGEWGTGLCVEGRGWELNALRLARTLPAHPTCAPYLPPAAAPTFAHFLPTHPLTPPLPGTKAQQLKKLAASKPKLTAFDQLMVDEDRKEPARLRGGGCAGGEFGGR